MNEITSYRNFFPFEPKKYGRILRRACRGQIKLFLKKKNKPNVWLEVILNDTYGTRYHSDKSSIGKGQIVTRIETMPYGWKNICTYNLIVFHSFIHDRSKPAICSLIPILDRLLQTLWHLQPQHSCEHQFPFISIIFNDLPRNQRHRR